MYGERAGDKVFKITQSYFSPNNTKLRLGLHLHDQNVSYSCNKFKQIFKTLPRDISFGHWVLPEAIYPVLAKNKIYADYSHAAYRHNEKYFFHPSYKIGPVLEVPVCCDPRMPINPFYARFHVVLYFIFVLYFSRSDKVLHFTFHSYDLFPLTLWKKFLVNIILLSPLIK